MAATADGIVYPIASDFIAPLNTHLQTLAETTQDALDAKAPSTPVAYTPTLSGITLGNGTVSAKYCKIGAVIVDEIVISFGSTTAVIAGTIKVLGLQASTSNEVYMPCGNATLYSGGEVIFGAVLSQSETSIGVYLMKTDSIWSYWENTSSTKPSGFWNAGSKVMVRTTRLAA
jgi:hypothetical protein